MRLLTRNLTRAFSLTLAIAVVEVAEASEQSGAIIDVRFDGVYRQVLPSTGDEWAPSWGRDDALYTGSNDGSGFGKIGSNAFAFGKLEGNDPYELRGTSINDMREFWEGQTLAEAAKWKTLTTYKIKDVVYRFIPCGMEADGSIYSCLVTSTDNGNSWSAHSHGPRRGALFRGTRFNAPTFVSFRREYGISLGRSDQYAFAVAYAGRIDGEDRYFLARVPIERLGQADSADWSFRTGDQTWTSDVNRAGLISDNSGVGSDGANWKTMNTYSVDGVLYMFVTRCHYPWVSADSKRRHIFQNSSIIKSTDSGRTWVRSAIDNLQMPMFPGKRFGTAYFVWYGKDGAATVDNADRYVYAVSNNGHFENGDDYIIGRVERSKLPNLSGADWSFYKKGDGMRDDSWTANLAESEPVLTNPGRSSMTGMTYVEALDRYVMVSWHYNRANFEAGIEAQDLSTVLEFFEAPDPWGPWTKVRSFETGRLGWFAPIVGQRFQSASDAGSVRVFLYASGFRTKAEGGLDFTLYKLNYMPITLSTRPIEHNNPTYVGGR